MVVNPSKYLRQLGPKAVAKWNATRDDDYESGLPDLSDWNLNEAQLTRINLRKIRMRGTKLSGANLVYADLTDADLSGADLRGARLTFATFMETKLTGANLAGAICGYTNWLNTDLSEVTGLETIRHAFPSSIGIDTMYVSRGRIPETFLRGCGVPMNLIDHLPNLYKSVDALQYHSCFISHNSKDKPFCRRLSSWMEENKLRVWFDEKDMKAGRKLHEQVTEAIRVFDKLLIVLSENSISSEWVKTEIYHARQRELREKRQILFPIRICDYETIRQWQYFDADSGKDLAREIREYYIPGDFQNWHDDEAFQIAFVKLLDALRANNKPPANS